MDELYERLIHVSIPEGMSEDEIVDAYARALCVAAGLRYSSSTLSSLLAWIDHARRQS